MYAYTKRKYILGTETAAFPFVKGKKPLKTVLKVQQVPQVLLLGLSIRARVRIDMSAQNRLYSGRSIRDPEEFTAESYPNRNEGKQCQ